MRSESRTAYSSLASTNYYFFLIADWNIDVDWLADPPPKSATTENPIIRMSGVSYNLETFGPLSSSAHRLLPGAKVKKENTCQFLTDNGVLSRHPFTARARMPSWISNLQYCIAEISSCALPWSIALSWTPDMTGQLFYSYRVRRNSSSAKKNS